MPTEYGGETIGERLTRLRTDLSRVRATIARHESNGSEFRIGGVFVSQVAYERATERERSLESIISALENRLAGSDSRPGVALTQTRIP